MQLAFDAYSCSIATQVAAVPDETHVSGHCCGVASAFGTIGLGCEDLGAARYPARGYDCQKRGESEESESCDGGGKIVVVNSVSEINKYQSSGAAMRQWSTER